MMGDYKTYLLEYTMHTELKMLCQNQVKNIFVIPSANSSLIWYGIIFVHDGMYENGAFRFTIFIPDKFPESCPRIIFNPIVYHPLIHPDTGELDIGHVWNPYTHHVYHVLNYIRQVFTNIDVTHAVNEEATQLYIENLNEFKAKIQLCINEIATRLYEQPPINSDDSHSIKFSPLDSEFRAKIRLSMINFVQNE